MYRAILGANDTRGVTPEARQRRRCPGDEKNDHGAQLLSASAKDLICGRLQRRIPVARDGPQIRVHLLHVRRNWRRNCCDADWRKNVGQLEGAGWNVQGAV